MLICTLRELTAAVIIPPLHMNHGETHSHKSAVSQGKKITVLILCRNTFSHPAESNSFRLISTKFPPWKFLSLHPSVSVSTGASVRKHCPWKHKEGIL